MDQRSGWYPDPDPDPDRTPGQLRWWDGDRWTDLTTSNGPGVTSNGPADAAAPRDEEMLAGPGGVPLGGRFRDAIDRRLRTIRASGRTSSVAAVLAVVVVLVVGLIARNSLLSTSTAGVTADGSPAPAAPRPRIPPLAVNCLAGQPTPAPTPSPPVPAGPRVTDFAAGISYAKMGAPWQPWNQIWFDAALRVVYRSGYYFVTQHDVAGTGADYYATVLSGSVPATVGDALHPDMACVAKHVADDARGSFYPKPNTRRELTDRPVVIDGHAGYVVKFHLSFDKAGNNARGELVEVLALDVDT
ncbi:MAG TPA: DUF2510 domain-containing protein, partial [Mycobacteriales bacterium]|nr:DUF2510 domain-containing protein [Mycobacteriales bacterium]